MLTLTLQRRKPCVTCVYTTGP